MLNQFVVIGRFESVTDNQMKINNNGKLMTLQVADNLVSNIKEYIKKGDLVGIKGKIDNNELIAEKITFLSNGKEVKK